VNDHSIERLVRQVRAMEAEAEIGQLGTHTTNARLRASSWVRVSRWSGVPLRAICHA
jgi:hypothetical protein